MGEVFQFHREIIVCGDDPLANTIIEELRGAGARIIRIASAGDLLGAGVHRARAVVCAGPDDAVNLEIALLARRYSPNVRVVARIADTVLRDAVAEISGPGAILNVADLATPSIVEAVLSRIQHGWNGVRCLGDPRRAKKGHCGRPMAIWPRWRWYTGTTRPFPGTSCRARDATSESTQVTGPR